MRKIYMIYALRLAMSRAGIEAFIILLSIGAMGSFVSFSNVLRNMPNPTQFKSFFNFSQSAFLETELIVQAALLTGVTVAGLLIRDIIKNFKEAAIAPELLKERAY